MIVHIEKVLVLLSVYHALQMSWELREWLIQALSSFGPTRVCSMLGNYNISSKKKVPNVENHNKPLFISGFLENKPITRVIVDNRLEVNIIPLQKLQFVGLTVTHLNLPVWSY